MFFLKDDRSKTRNRERQIKFLENAFIKIAMGVAREPNLANAGLQKNFEEAVAEIQLYGTKKEIEILHETLTKNIPFDKLLEELRSRLRKELEIEETNSGVIPFRLMRIKWKNPDKKDLDG